ncbi:hypothetical protein [Moraxella catarrhalis]|uniref:hypothetical protein n=1 Tax=Moraxella catarrhalis TaxID=480 RepID=UPI0022281AA2|nr:hypothetical protein [Moraxella catarrhalis]
MPIAGSLSDKLGRKTVYIGGVVLMMIYALPYFWMLNTGSVLWLNIATIVGLGIIWTPITAVLGTMFSEIFKSNVRYTGITLGYQIGAAIAGGTAPMVALWLLNTFDLSYTPIAIYIICMGLVSITAVWAAGEHAGKEMID